MAITTTLSIWIALLAVGMLVAVVIWANQRELAFQASEARANQAESRAATAEAAVTLQAQIQSATATALAYASSPAAAVDRSLSLLLAADREPSDERLRALSDAFAPPALAVVRPEVEHLLSGGLHLGDDSTYDLQVLGTDYSAPTEAQVHTRERWLYDEVNASDQRARCLVEMSEQTYTLQRTGGVWQIADVDLGSTSRTDCPAT
jgi:hypothetical protein